MIPNEGIIAGSVAILVALALASQAHPEPSYLDCTGLFAARADPSSEWEHLHAAPQAIELIDVEVYTGRVPVRPILDAAKSRAPRRRLSNLGLFGCDTIG
jgi:hypothetical protein